MRVVIALLLWSALIVGPAHAAPEGTLTWGLHVTLAHGGYTHLDRALGDTAAT